MIVREIQPWELDKLVPLAERFHRESAIGGNFNAVRLLDVLYTQSGKGLLVALGIFDDDALHGCLVGHKADQFMTDVTLLSEILWYVEPEHRTDRAWVKALRLFEAAAMVDCDGLVVARLSAGNGKLHRYYEKQGYRDVETHYLKLFTPAPPCP